MHEIAYCFLWFIYIFIYFLFFLNQYSFKLGLPEVRMFFFLNNYLTDNMASEILAIYPDKYVLSLFHFIPG